MKTLSIFFPSILLALSFSACGGKVEVTPSEGVSISHVYTAAAITLTAQASAITPTVLVLPTTTPTIWASPTFTSSPPTPLSINASYTTTYGFCNAAYVSDVTIPDGTILAPGESFTKTWEFQNTGSCDWEADFILTFETGTAMDGDDSFIGKPVSTGEMASFSVTLVAPETEGSYTGYWRLSTDSGTAFGSSVFVLIVVSEDAATSTTEYTSTPTNTATVVDDSTNTPSSTSTATPTPTTVEKSVETSPDTPTAVEDEPSQPDTD